MQNPSGRERLNYVQVKDTRLSYRVAGDGPPVLLIQGVGLHGDGWLPQVAGLAPSYRCLSFDNRGTGHSELGSGAISVKTMAEDALAILDAVGWESAHVVGHSLGGVVAQHLGLTAAGRVRSLSLLCTVARGRDATKLSGRMLWLGIRSSLGSRRMRRRAFLRIVMPPSVLIDDNADALAESLAPIFGHDLADRPPIAMKQLAALRAYDATPRLAELGRFPTLVASAAYDPIAPPRYGCALAEAIPGARYVELADSSHGVTIQRAEEVNALLIEHLRSAEGAHDGGFQQRLAPD
jgi:pimeloyl-ACP methyl ester carboxylesterase